MHESIQNIKKIVFEQFFMSQTPKNLNAIFESNQITKNEFEHIEHKT